MQIVELDICPGSKDCFYFRLEPVNIENDGKIELRAAWKQNDHDIYSIASGCSVLWDIRENVNHVVQNKADDVKAWTFVTHQRT